MDRSKRNLLLKVGALMVAVVLVGGVYFTYFTGTNEDSTGETELTTAQKIAMVTDNSSIITDFKDGAGTYERTIRLIPGKKVEKLKEEKPALFGPMPRRDLYLVEYKWQNRGIMTLVDLKDMELLRTVRTVNMPDKKCSGQYCTRETVSTNNGVNVG